MMRGPRRSPGNHNTAPHTMNRTILTNTGLATMAAGCLLFLLAFVPPIGTNKNMVNQMLAGLLLTHAAVLPLAAASRCD